MSGPVRRVAALDCGTNSLRLLVVEAGRDGGPVEVERTMEVVRLGEGVDRTGAFAPQALERTFAALDRAAQRCRALGVAPGDVRFVATSASRDVRNREEFAAGVAARLGVAPEVVSGAEEARLSFTGATAGLPGRAAPVLVVDLGGGSTELVLGGSAPGGPAVTAARSVDVGSVRMTERHLRSDPPTPAEADAVRTDVLAALDDVERDVDLAAAATVVGVAGTVTTVTAAALELSAYRPGDTHGVVLGLDVVRAACDRLLRATRAERAAMPFVHPGRVDVIGAGALVWRTVLDRLAERAGTLDVTTSEHDLLDGAAAGLLAR